MNLQMIHSGLEHREITLIHTHNLFSKMLGNLLTVETMQKLHWQLLVCLGILLMYDACM